MNEVSSLREEMEMRGVYTDPAKKRGGSRRQRRAISMSSRPS